MTARVLIGAAAPDRVSVNRTRAARRDRTAGRRIVEQRLADDWSPEQIAGWLSRVFPDDAELRVSHEPIYRSLFVQAKGTLAHGLTRHLRTRRAVRQPGSRNRGNGRGQLVDMVSISQRPAEAAHRAVPGHWEGDLLLGSGMSGIATLVERSSRLVLLVELDDIRAATRRRRARPSDPDAAGTAAPVADWATRRNSVEHRTRRLVAQLENLGHSVTLQPATS